MASMTEHLAKNLPIVGCAPPDLQGLTPQQIAALHVFKYKVLASLNKLYMTVPADIANPLIDKYMPWPPSDG
jgi:hypothetical protein